MQEEKINKINPCPFCGSNDVEFRWTMYLHHGKVICKNYSDSCCALGPEVNHRKYDNEEKMINRAIKRWNKAK